MIAGDIKWLHVEASTRCNAWCPACPRNNNGFGLISGLIEEDIDTNSFVKVLDQLPNLYGIQFCGNHGDPIISKNILDLIQISKKYVKKIQIHTNGGLRSTIWWNDFADLLSDIDHDVWFGIDGIDEIHEIYRQGTRYKKVIENASAFINNGGIATWQFIPYAHNEHQIKQCIILSQKLRFKRFKLVTSFRENRRHVKHYRTGKEFELLPPNSIYNIIKEITGDKLVNAEQCMHLSMPSVYLSVNGKISTCCYFGGINLNKTFDSIDELLNNKLDLTEKICITNCGR